MSVVDCTEMYKVSYNYACVVRLMCIYTYMHVYIIPVIRTSKAAQVGISGYIDSFTAITSGRLSNSVIYTFATYP